MMFIVRTLSPTYSYVKEHRTMQEAGTGWTMQEAGTSRTMQDAGTSRTMQEVGTSRTTQEAGTSRTICMNKRYITFMA